VDTLRLYEMFMGPLDASKPWTTRDMVGIFRFLQRLWRNHVDPATGDMLITDDEPDEDLLRFTHRTIKAVTDDMEHLGFNTAVARMFELNNELVGRAVVPRTVSEAFLRLLAPFAPHVCEELWRRLGHDTSIAYAEWPEYDPALAAAETVTMVVQVNGKVRDRIEVPADISPTDAEAAALGSERVRAYTAGNEPDRVIVRAPKLVNVVVR
jgi:leucyl-tRNA synthetase